MGDERRKTPRFAVDIPARLYGKGSVQEVRVRDLCRDALFVEVAGEWPLGTQVTVTAEFPGTAPPLPLAGSIVRIAPPEEEFEGVAVLFRDLTPAAATTIDLFLAGLTEQV